MDDNQSKTNDGNEDSGTYQLDLDQASEDQVDDVMRDALAAVEAVEEKKLKQKTSEEEPSLEIEVEEAAPEAEVIDAEEAFTGEDKNPGQHNQNAEVEELRNRLMRTLADFDNFRKRTEKEKEAHKRFAVADALKDFLPVADNLDRALASSGTVEELKKGVEMIQRQQVEVFKRWGVVPVKAVGESFNPAVHEAVAREDSADVDQPTVTGELQRGYMLHDRLLRPAMVSVAMPTSRPAPSPDAGSEAHGDESGDEPN